MKKRFFCIIAILTALLCGCLVFAACGDGEQPGAPATDVAITLSGMKTEFEFGEEFSTGDLVVTAKRSNDTSYTVSADKYTVDSSAYNKSVAGEYNIVVKLKNSDISEKYKVTVKPETPAPPTDSSIVLSGMKTEFEFGEEFSYLALKVTVKRTDDSEYTLNRSEYTIDYSAYDPETAGEYIIAVNMKNSTLSSSYTVTVLPEVVHSWDEDGALKILMIGNSFSDDTLEHAWNIARSLGIKEVYLGGLYIGGCTLDTHANNALGDAAAYEYRTNASGSWSNAKNQKMSDAIRSTDWDFISLQQASGSSGMQDTYGSLSYLISYVQSEMQDTCHAKLVWNMTWAYQQNSSHGEFSKYGNDQTTMYGKIVDAVNAKVATEKSISAVIPSGTAIQNARTSYVGDTITRDGYHLSYGLGRYIAGLTLIHKLTGLAIDDIDFVPSGMDREDLPMAIDAVKKAVQTPFAVTQSAYKTEPNPPVIDESKYTALDFELTQGFYNSTDANNPTSIITEDSDFNRSFLATKRFTPDEIPLGSLIVLARGWQYRPEHWTNDKAQPDRADNATVRMATVTPEWWNGYTHRAFNIAKAGASEQIADRVDDVKAAFKIYIPKAAENEYLLSLGYTKLDYDVTQGFYNSMDAQNYSTPITNNTNLTPKFYATKRFTKDELPLGTVLVIEKGWQYRPDCWIDDAKQTTRPGNVSTHVVVVDEGWWANRIYRAFNIGKTDGSKIVGQEEQAKAAFSVYLPKDGKPALEYEQKQLVLSQGFYDSTLASNHTGIIADNAGLSNKFYATERFTKADLPVGSIIIIEAGWQYRPEAWIDDEVQSSRPANTSVYSVTVTEEWWANYRYRAFNISKPGLPVIEGKDAEAKAAFKILIPKN